MNWLWRQKRELDPKNRIRIQNVTADWVALALVGPLSEAVLRAVSSTSTQRDLFKSLLYPFSCSSSPRPPLLPFPSK